MEGGKDARVCDRCQDVSYRTGALRRSSPSRGFPGLKMKLEPFFSKGPSRRASLEPAAYQRVRPLCGRLFASVCRSLQLLQLRLCGHTARTRFYGKECSIISTKKIAAAATLRLALPPAQLALCLLLNSRPRGASTAEGVGLTHACSKQGKHVEEAPPPQGSKKLAKLESLLERPRAWRHWAELRQGRATPVASEEGAEEERERECPWVQGRAELGACWGRKLRCG